MRNQSFLSFIKILFIFFFSYLSLPCIADQYKSNYKGEASASIPSSLPMSMPVVQYYKGETEAANDATAARKESKYGGQIYNNDLYQGAIKGPDYSPETDRSLWDGFYVGAEVGYDSYKVHDSIDNTVIQQTIDLNAVGMSYTAVGGYGQYFDPPLYLGTEFFYNYSRANASEMIEINTENVKTEILNNYGVSLLPGIKLSDNTLFYLKCGYTRTELKTYETVGTLSINNTQSNGVNGVHFGAGMEANIYKNWSIRAEYTHLNSKQFSTRTGTTVSPSDNQVMLGVILHFA